MAAGLSTWFEIMDYTYQDRGNMFRKTIVRNRLQNIMLELYDKIQRKVSSQCPTTSNRQMELFHRFVFLVHDYCIEEREVSFYADKLCISTRYLSAIVRRTTHQSAKELIDKIVVMEIKVFASEHYPADSGDRLQNAFPGSVLFGALFQETYWDLSIGFPAGEPIVCRQVARNDFTGGRPRFTRTEKSARVKRFLWTSTTELDVVLWLGYEYFGRPGSGHFEMWASPLPSIVYRLSYASRHATAGIASAFCECISFLSEDERR